MRTKSSDAGWTFQTIDARTDVQLFKMMLWFRDKDTAMHCVRVAQYAARLAERIGLAEDDIERIARAALLHDIGKIAVPDAVLRKSAPLSDEETSLMQAHASVGATLVGMHWGLGNIDTLVRHHHERFDGSGYPVGLRGYHIPTGSRIIAVADSFDAMTTDRPYRAAMAVDVACSELLQGAGSQFDPAIVHEFLAFIELRIQLHDSLYCA